MADDEDLDEDLEGDIGDEGEDDEELGPSGGKGGKKKLIILIAGALLLVVGGVATAYFTGMLDDVVKMIVGGEGAPGEGGEGGEMAEGVDAVFHDVEEILVNLNTGARKSTFLKIRVSLELANPEDLQRIEALMPKIVDSMEVYLRELRVEDLKGSAGMYRLREELLTRVNGVVAPAKVNNVLFKEMLVQ